jgi:chloramphenicol-sensitive protein RarD
MWGLVPLFWPLLEPAGALEILAHRFVWSFVFVGALLVAQRRVRRLGETIRDRRRMALLSAAAVLIAVNWYTYIYGVNSGHVVETALGYFINPLVTVLLGVFVLRERLRRLQWMAVGVATVAVAVLAIDYGRPPWIALTLAVSFGSYGLVKKTVGAVPAADGLAIEAGVVLIPACALLVVYELRGDGTFGHAGAGNALLLMSAGVVTAIPLLFFAASARRVPLVILGLLQFFAPVLQFLVGVVVRHEEMPPARWLGFALVWVGLVLFATDQVRIARTRRRASVLVPEPTG